MTATQERKVTIEPPRPAPIRAELLAGAVLEVADLEATRRFYERVFDDRPGEWFQPDGRANALAYRYRDQTIEFVRRAHPRTLSDSGQHWGYRVAPGRVEALAQELERQGAGVNWWHEDHPVERQVTAHLHDPSGNRVQIVASDDRGLLLDHAAIEVHDFDYVMYLYITTIGGVRDYYHGWLNENVKDARKWLEEGDPCAPWTRKDNPNYRDFLVDGRPTAESRGTNNRAGLRVPRPNSQIFISFGPTRLGLISATKVRQEPPEGQVKGTPRLVFTTRQMADEVMGHLRPTPIPRKREGSRVFVKDADGVFSELRCASA
jgi:predicted enzyme related to lactoylglutathione lyase